METALKDIDAKQANIYAQQAAQAEFAEEERKFQRDVMLEDMKRQRNTSYEEQVRQLNFQDKVELMGYEIDKQMAILDNKMRIEDKRGKNNIQFTDDDGNVVLYNPQTKQTEMVFNNKVSQMASEISSYSQ